MNTSLPGTTNSSVATATDNSSLSDALAVRSPSPVRKQAVTLGNASDYRTNLLGTEQSAPACHVHTLYVCFMRSPRGFPLQAFLPMIFTATFVELVIFGHLNRSFYLLIYLFIYLLTY